MLSVIVLGAAAGGGLPQWNCGCDICAASRSDQVDLRRTQASIAFSADQTNWFLINASPDLRQQLLQTPHLHPRSGRLRHSPIVGVILSNGEVDAVAGLLSMREGSPFTLYAHSRVLQILRENSIFNVLGDKHVRRMPIEIDAVFEPTLHDGSGSGIKVEVFEIPGKSAWYLESDAAQFATDQPGDTLGLRITDKESGQSFYFIAACARVTPDLAQRLTGAPLVFFDGTVWRDDELIVAGLGQKSGQRMGHIAMSGERGAIAALADAGIGQKIFLHINNSNPVLMPHSAERAFAEAAGWQIATDGMEITL